MSKKIVTTDTPVATSSTEVIHTLSIFVNNKAGVLMRICQVFARRGYNIESLVVSQGRDANFSRMTIGLKGAPEGLEQIIKQVNKLIDVIHCYEHTAADAVVKEMLLIKFLVADGQKRTDALQIIEHFGGNDGATDGDDAAFELRQCRAGIPVAGNQRAAGLQLAADRGHGDS